ncbi:MAG: hypothetical protein JNM34_05505, partial [Chthonomonadaceae bacterium]|nr:hypothetical protein [Chthonomonadaceae bacterium]
MRNLAARRSPLAVMAIACVVCLSPRAHAQSGTLFGDWKIQIIDRLGHTEVESFRVGPTNRMGVRLHDGNNSLGQAAVVEIPSSTIATALTLPSGWTFSTATMTNGNGASCGWSDASGWAGISPIYWSSNSSFTRIADTVNNFTVGKAWALNSSGVTVGELAQNLTSEKRPLAYSPGIPELVRLDRGGLDQGVADAVNNAGVVVGHTYLTDGSSGRIVTWTPDNQGSYLSSLPVTISGWPTDRTGFAV